MYAIFFQKKRRKGKFSIAAASHLEKKKEKGGEEGEEGEEGAEGEEGESDERK